MDIQLINIAETARAAMYLDPSAITFALQIMIGVVVATGAAIGIILTKIKKNAKDKLGIDLEKKKEMEDEVVEYSDPDEETADEQIEK